MAQVIPPGESTPGGRRTPPGVAGPARGLRAVAAAAHARHSAGETSSSGTGAPSGPQVQHTEGRGILASTGARPGAASLGETPPVGKAARDSRVGSPERTATLAAQACADLQGLEELSADQQLERLRAVHARLRSQLDQTKDA